MPGVSLNYFKMRTFIFFSLFSFSYLFSYSQRIEVGSEVGYVTSDLASNGYQISAITCFYPKHAIFYLGSGLSFQKENEWNFIKLPLGIIFCPGRKVKFLIGIGLAVNYVILQSIYFNKHSVLSKSDLMLNSFFLMGLSFNVNNYWRIFIKPQFDMGLTNLYKTYAGSTRQDYYTTRSFSINIGVSYSIFSKNN